MEPASTIIKRLGGDSAVASAIGIHRTRVSNWKRPREKGGSGGHIPAKHIPALIEIGRELGEALSHADFFPTPSDEGRAA
jgi:DNA-binding transcriptional regulator YdaS (Cro superfamily)